MTCVAPTFGKKDLMETAIIRDNLILIYLRLQSISYDVQTHMVVRMEGDCNYYGQSYPIKPEITINIAYLQGRLHQ